MVPSSEFQFCDQSRDTVLAIDFEKQNLLWGDLIGGVANCEEGRRRCIKAPIVVDFEPGERNNEQSWCYSDACFERIAIPPALRSEAGEFAIHGTFRDLETVAIYDTQGSVLSMLHDTVAYSWCGAVDHSSSR